MGTVFRGTKIEKSFKPKRKIKENNIGEEGGKRRGKRGTSSLLPTCVAINPI